MGCLSVRPGEDRRLNDGHISAHHKGRNRLLSVDSMRGAAMVFVILQHCFHLIDATTVSPLIYDLLYLITKIASVAFMTVSGMMIGFFYASTADWVAVYRRFAKRALLLVLVAHPGIQLARYFYFGPDHLAMFWHNLAFDYPITDTIAVALLVSPVFVKFRSLAIRVGLIALLLVATPAVVILYQPDSSAGAAIKASLFGGVSGPDVPFWGWPIVPWVGIFLCGFLMGPALARVKSGDLPPQQLIRKMLGAAAFLAVGGVVLTLAYKVLKLTFGPSLPSIVYDSIYPSRTTTLLPVYLALLLACLAVLMYHIDVRKKYIRAEWILSVFGRTSLFTYVTQFIFVHSIPGIFGLQGKMNLLECSIHFVLSLCASWLLSYAYGRARGWIISGDFAYLSGGQIEKVTS